MYQRVYTSRKAGEPVVLVRSSVVKVNEEDCAKNMGATSARPSHDAATLPAALRHKYAADYR